MNKAVLRKILSRAHVILSDVRRDSKILFYHDIHNDELGAFTSQSTPVSLFIKHVQIIRSHGYEIVSKITKPDGQIMITLDDGHRGILDVWPIIRTLDIPLMMFVTTSFLNKKGFLTEDELLKLSQEGLSVGSHTHHHLELTSLPDYLLEKELTESKNNLEGLLNKGIVDLAFPRGKYNDHVIEKAKSFLYENLYSTVPQNYQPNSTGLFGRYFVQDYSANELKFALKGGMDIFSGRYQKLAHQ